jgi:hypothetical protein
MDDRRTLMNISLRTVACKLAVIRATWEKEAGQ